MTSEEKRAARHTARIFSSVRKARGLTQVTVAKQLNVSQGALSKLERGLLIPSVFQWFEFCNMTSIPADSHVSGYVDFGRPVEKSNGAVAGLFKIPKRYMIEQASTVRSMLPLIKWLEKKEGEAKSEKVLREMGMDPDYFVQLDHTISLRFGLDLIKYLKAKGHYSEADQREILKSVSQNQFHGVLWSAYANTESPLSSLNLLLSKSNYYEQNFRYKVENVTKSYMDFSSTPEATVLKDKEILQHDCHQFICTHRSHYFANMGQWHSQNKITVEEKECSFEGADRCVFRLSM